MTSSNSDDIRSTSPEPSGSRSPPITLHMIELDRKEHPRDPSSDKELRITDLFPNRQLHPTLNPMHADVQSPYDLPLCWLGVPFSRDAMVRYAKKAGLDAISSDGPWKGLVDKGQTWCNVCDHFREIAGVELELKDVIDCQNLLLAFFSNWQAASITSEKLGYCRILLLEMGYADDVRPMWFLDRNNFA
ncbi:hypothetical protein V8D89_004197 [Ganoderma adspersum]